MEPQMSDEESKENPAERQPYVSPPSSENKGIDEIQIRNSEENADTKAREPVKLSKFQAFMHKHFPDAKAHDRWTLVFTFVIAISTFFYTIFAGWTLREIH